MNFPSPSRNIPPLRFQIDTNRINARQRLAEMNKLEKWEKDGVITIDMSAPSFKEASRSQPQASKAAKHIFSLDEEAERTPKETEIFDKITNILFPDGPKNENQWKDVEVVFHAWKYKYILITDDGDSRTQPDGILGKRTELEKQFGVKILRDTEAVECVREKIKERDDLVKEYSHYTGKSLPDWIGKD